MERGDVDVNVNEQAAFPVVAVRKDDILPCDDRFNVCNLGPKPSDYAERLANTETHVWVDSFHDKYACLDITHPWHLDVLWRAAAIGKVTGRVPRAFEDELQSVADALAPAWVAARATLASPPFVRSETVSLKTGVHGPGPYTTVQAVLESLVTARGTHTPLAGGTPTPLKLYLLPWVNIQLEFRVFVHQGTVTGVSQQHWARVDERYSQHAAFLPGMLAFSRACVTKLPPYLRLACTMDVALTDAGWYFIEPNGFGAPYAAGSSLFHWERDDLTRVQGYRYLVA